MSGAIVLLVLVYSVSGQKIIDENSECASGIQIYTESKIIITSEGYPQSYPPNYQCSYFVRGPKCPTSFTVEFLDFNVENSPKCSKDRLEIEHQHVLCGYKEGIQEYYSEKGFLKMKFVSDGYGGGKGFKILITRQPCHETAKITNVNSHKWHATNKNVEHSKTKQSTEITQNKDAEKCCQNVYSAKRFILTSPNFPYSMSTPADCVFEIFKNNDNVCKLKININFFFMGKSGSECAEGFLEIDDKFICGCKNHLKLITSFDEARSKTIRYVSRGHVPNIYNSGFVLHVTQVECSKKKTPVIYNKNRPILFYNRIYREGWPNFADQETINNSLTPTEAAPLEEFSEVLEGQGEFDNHDTSSNNTLFAEHDFEYDYCLKWNRKQFNLLATKKVPVCKQPEEHIKEQNCVEFNELQGYFLSPGYPTSYPDNLNMCYRFKKRPGYCAFRLNMKDFHLEHSTSCEKDYLLFPNQSKYCGSRSAKTIVLNLRNKPSADFYFVTDDSDSDSGFFGTYKQISCDNAKKLPHATTVNTFLPFAPISSPLLSMIIPPLLLSTDIDIPFPFANIDSSLSPTTTAAFSPSEIVATSVLPTPLTLSLPQTFDISLPLPNIAGLLPSEIVATFLPSPITATTLPSSSIATVLPDEIVATPLLPTSVNTLPPFLTFVVPLSFLNVATLLPSEIVTIFVPSVDNAFEAVATSSPSPVATITLPSSSETSVLPSDTVATPSLSTTVDTLSSLATVDTSLPSPIVPTTLPTSSVDTVLPTDTVATSSFYTTVDTLSSLATVDTSLPSPIVPTTLPTSSVDTVLPTDTVATSSFSTTVDTLLSLDTVLPTDTVATPSLYTTVDTLSSLATVDTSLPSPIVPTTLPNSSVDTVLSSDTVATPSLSTTVDTPSSLATVDTSLPSSIVSTTFSSSCVDTVLPSETVATPPLSTSVDTVSPFPTVATSLPSPTVLTISPSSSVATDLPPEAVATSTLPTTVGTTPPSETVATPPPSDTVATLPPSETVTTLSSSTTTSTSLPPMTADTLASPTTPVTLLSSTTDQPKISCDKVVQSTMFTIDLFGTNERICTFTIKKTSPDVCAVRLYIEHMDLICGAETLLIDRTTYCGRLTELSVRVELADSFTAIVYRKSSAMDPIKGLRLRIRGFELSSDECSKPEIINRSY